MRLNRRSWELCSRSTTGKVLHASAVALLSLLQQNPPVSHCMEHCWMPRHLAAIPGIIIWILHCNLCACIMQVCKRPCGKIRESHATCSVPTFPNRTALARVFRRAANRKEIREFSCEIPSWEQTAP